MQNLLDKIFAIFKFTLERSFTATPIFDFSELKLSIFNIDFSPAEIDLSEQFEVNIYLIS